MNHTELLVIATRAEAFYRHQSLVDYMLTDPGSTDRLEYVLEAALTAAADHLRHKADVNGDNDTFYALYRAADVIDSLRFDNSALL